jgi:D-xylose 1-dehydrogenase
MRATYPSLRERRVFITGAATGIGAGFVRAFTEHGAQVAFVDLLQEEGARLAAETGAKFQHCDVNAPGALAAALDAAADAMGGLHVLVNNVAHDARHAAAALSDEAWRAALAVNLDAAFIAARTAHPWLVRAGGGVIINISSINALLGASELVAYDAAKGGINALTKALAREWGGDRIRVNAVSPGWVVTERQLKLWLTPEAEAEWMKLVALPDRLGVEDIAAMVLFLASDEARMITGQNFIVDGGRT